MRWMLAAWLLTALGFLNAAAAGEPLVGKWRIEHVRGGDSFDPATTLFEVTTDGRISSTVGCNRIVGKPSLKGDRLRFGPMAATRMACPPPLDQLETAYMASLDAVRSWRIEGTRLTLVDERGPSGRRARALRIRGRRRCGRSMASNVAARLRRALHAASRGNWVWAMWL